MKISQWPHTVCVWHLQCKPCMPFVLYMNVLEQYAMHEMPSIYFVSIG